MLLASVGTGTSCRESWLNDEVKPPLPSTALFPVLSDGFDNAGSVPLKLPIGSEKEVPLLFRSYHYYIMHNQ